MIISLMNVMKNKVLLLMLSMVLIVISGCVDIGTSSLIAPTVSGEFFFNDGENFDGLTLSTIYGLDGSTISSSGCPQGTSDYKCLKLFSGTIQNGFTSLSLEPISTKAKIRLSYYHRAISYESGEYAALEVDTGNGYEEVRRYIGNEAKGLSDSVDIVPNPLVGVVNIRWISMGSSKTAEVLYLDEIKLESLTVPCSDSNICDNDYLCDPSINVCVKGCSKATESVDCVGGMVCSSDLHGSCVTAGSAVVTLCSSDSDCPSNQLCGSSGQCILVETVSCSSNSDCGVGGFCEVSSGKCFTCPGGGVYNTNSDLCELPIITQQLSCSSNSDCGTGGTCDSGVCKFCPQGTFNQATNSCEVTVSSIIPVCENVCVDSNTGLQVSC